jgi:hypothetical protein
VLNFALKLIKPVIRSQRMLENFPFAIDKKTWFLLVVPEGDFDVTSSGLGYFQFILLL